LPSIETKSNYKKYKLQGIFAHKSINQRNPQYLNIKMDYSKAIQISSPTNVNKS